jgi:hypothetical protein
MQCTVGHRWLAIVHQFAPGVRKIGAMACFTLPPTHRTKISVIGMVMMISPHGQAFSCAACLLLGSWKDG